MNRFDKSHYSMVEHAWVIMIMTSRDDATCLGRVKISQIVGATDDNEENDELEVPCHGLMCPLAIRDGQYQID